ncbi:hypothetical protein N181_30400 [Sinorhizobium fredii USDA 205]|uniref:Uncharacterized protein n=2 Tax=Sinorhizobium TaxID=28105 RepID=I3XHA6_SINF2|nr:hypothetical protein USDA257_p05470 [Sinorhizobium fredii USDA 257]ASY60567.1 hypothetical protein SS05631_a41820 [Sinorhizobium sp. CCBAU 05631]ASY67207.1 hypothetical protein SJ05684_a38930 [Sinorhizobium sojae CCBAU 05684]AWI61912.1 hypothetical protein AB395_00004387 [Sinorhizobium fredii CCBAU 45436]AWM29834.1 hypothetical protein AOX55_00004398 [Sinorhizobium fredii CCBAU 25509]KSV91982.1 hypothetical protein N181_30400 [Sinorhizobium fredii USDA 205]
MPPARRTKPYIYSEIEIQALVAAALSLPPALDAGITAGSD